VEISEAQASVDAYIGQFADGYWAPLSNLARLMEEVGELSREMNHRFGQKPKKADEPEQDLALELADILFVIIAIANQQGIDLDAAFRQVLAKYTVRDADRWTRK
jgi:NTP pyrophosphatase (non-canonical NTP hydrolase)